MSVWAVTTGSYSDYRVECLFTSRELAAAFVAIDDTFEVEAFPLFDRMPSRVVWYYEGLRLNDGDPGRYPTDDDVEPRQLTNWEFAAPKLTNRAHTTIRYTGPWTDNTGTNGKRRDTSWGTTRHQQDFPTRFAIEPETWPLTCTNSALQSG